jgi:hypothetical protein
MAILGAGFCGAQAIGYTIEGSSNGASIYGGLAIIASLGAITLAMEEIAGRIRNPSLPPPRVSSPQIPKNTQN